MSLRLFIELADQLTVQTANLLLVLNIKVVGLSLELSKVLLQL